MNFIDILIIIFIGITCLEGFRRGFIKTLFDTVGLMASFFLSRIFYGGVESFLLKNTKIYDKIHDFFAVKAVGFTEILQGTSKDVVNGFKQSLNLPVELQKVVSDMFQSGISSSGTDIFSLFVDNISHIILRSLSFLITFLAIYTVMVIASNLINIIFKLPVLNITNRVFGLGVGLFKSAVILYIVFALASPLIGFVKDNKVVDGVVNSESSKIFYKNNLILNYLSYKGFFENKEDI